jgi:hypothetical protein
LVIAFALSFGLANGLMTIIRALAPAEWFEEMSYPYVLGTLSAAALFMRACGPALTAMLIEVGGISNTITLLILIALLALGSFYLGLKK